MHRRRFVQSGLAAAIIASLPAKQSLAALVNLTTEVSADVPAITGDGAEVVLKRSAVQDLSNSLRGQLLLRGDDGYDKHRRVLYPEYDKYPGLIVRCTGSADVRNAVNFARADKLLVAVKCGGHGAAGMATCDGGMLIDLSLLRNVRVDPIARTADVSGGSLLGHMDHDTMAYGLVTTAGTVSHTGVAGLTLGGGFGRVGRRFGLALDNVLEVDIITADGEFRRANKDENSDLYWGVRGGGGNFGIVTSFKFQLHPMQRQVVRGRFTFPGSEAKEVLNFFAEYSENAADDLYVSGGIAAGANGLGVSVSIILNRGLYVRVPAEQVTRVIFVLDFYQAAIITEVVRVHLTLGLLEQIIGIEAYRVGLDILPVVFDIRPMFPALFSEGPAYAAKHVTL